MSDQYIGEIRIFAGTFAPQDWMFCDGATLAISEYTTLFQLLGTNFGGDGQTTFNLPDLRGRVPVHMGNLSGGGFYPLASSGGVEQVTLNSNQIAAHTHPVLATGSGQVVSPQGAYFAVATSNAPSAYTYSPNAPTTAMITGSVLPAGGNQPHSNIQPSLGLNFIIALNGIYPSQN